MSITSTGYAGDVDAAEWAKTIPRVGASTYGVDSLADWAVTAAAGTRNIQIAAGSGWGHGVRDVLSAAVVLSLPAAASGVRWWLIVARRTWAANTTSFELVDAGSVAAIPTRNENPGMVDDQPLALVRVTTGAAIAEIKDLRVVAHDGGLLAFDDLTLTYMNRPGTVLRIGLVQWRRWIDATGSPQWEKSGESTGWADGTKNTGWTWTSATFAVKKVGGVVFGKVGGAQRTVGWTKGNELGQIPAGYRPESTQWAVNMWGDGREVFNIQTDGRITADGDSQGSTGVSLVWSYPASN